MGIIAVCDMGPVGFFTSRGQERVVACHEGIGCWQLDPSPPEMVGRNSASPHKILLLMLLKIMNFGAFRGGIINVKLHWMCIP